MTKSLESRVTRLEVGIQADEIDADPVALEAWGNLVDWACAVREVGGYDTAFTLVTSAKSTEGLPDALFVQVNWLTGICLSHNGIPFTDDLYSWIPRALYLMVDTLIGRGVTPDQLKHPQMMRDFVGQVKAWQQPSNGD